MIDHHHHHHHHQDDHLGNHHYHHHHYPINDQFFLSYRNQSIDLLCKLIDWFLYDGEHWSLIG